MNAEKVLATLNEIIEQIDKGYPDYDFKKYFDKDMNSVTSSNNGAPSMMADLCKALQMDILKSSDKCKANRTKAVLRILKNSAKSGLNDMYSNAVVDNDDNTMMVTDGYRLIIFVNPVDGIPTSDNEAMLGLKNSVLNNRSLKECDRSLYIGSLAELKKELKIDKANKNYIVGYGGKKVYLYFFGVDEFDHNKPVVNLEYLIDIVEAMKNPKVAYRSKDWKAGAYFTDDENNKAILLPLRPKDEKYKEILSRKVVK